MAIAADLTNNIRWGRVGGVGDDADSIMGISISTAHQHRGSAHGQTIEDHRRAGTKTIRSILKPGMNIMPFPDPKGYGPSAAVTVGALVYNKGIESQFLCQGMSAAAVPQGCTAVTMEQQHQRSLVVNMIVPPLQGYTILGTNLNGFVWILFHDADDAEDGILHRFILRSSHGIIGAAASLFRGVEADAVAVPGKCQNADRQKGDERGNDHDDRLQKSLLLFTIMPRWQRKSTYKREKMDSVCRGRTNVP